MSTNVGTLQIEIATNVARIRADMDEAKKIIGGSMKDVEQYVGYAKTALLGLGGALTARTFINVIEGAIEAKVKLYNLSVQTGITVEALSGLGKVAKFSNTDLTDIASASNKLSKALFTQNEDSKGAAQALKALNLDFKDFKGLNADQQFVAVAKAMGQFEDGTSKSAAAMLLYGKTGATLLPFLKELEERGYAVGKQTTASALEAKRYEDNLITLKAAAEQWKRQLAEALLPTLISITGAMVDARREADSFNIVGEALKITMQTVAIVGANVGFVFGGVGREIGAVAAQMKVVDDAAKNSRSLLDPFGMKGALAAINGPAYTAISAAVKSDGEKALAELREYERKILGLQSKIGTAAEFQRGDKDTSPVKRKQLHLDDARPGAGPVKDAADGYDALMKKIRQKIALDQAEVEMGRKLTETERFQIGIYEEVENNFSKLSIKKLLAIDEATQLAIEVGKEREAFEAEAKWLNEDVTAKATYLEGQLHLRNQLQDTTKAAVDQLRMFGLTAEELRALETARLRDAAAALQQKAAQAALAADMAGGGGLSEKSRLLREQAQALNDTADARDRLAAKQDFAQNDPYAGARRAVKEYLADVKHAGDATYGAVANSIKGLEDLTVTALSGGDVKNAARAWVSGIISEINRLYIVKPLLADIFGSQGGAGGSGGGWIGTAISLIGNFFGGGGYSATGGVGYSSGAGISGGRADGGPVSAGRNYLVGERGPEILRMGSQAGSVIPNSQIGGGSRPVTVNVMNNGQPVQAKSSQRETSEGTVIDLVLDAVAADMAGGGKVHDATQRRFGLNPGGTTPRY